MTTLENATLDLFFYDLRKGLGQNQSENEEMKISQPNDC